MSVSNPYLKLMKRVVTVLTGDATLTAMVPAGNIFPQLDPMAASAGNQISFGWTNSVWDVRQKRGVGSFLLRVHAVENVAKAEEIFQRVRLILTPRSLTLVGTVTVHRLREVTAGQELSQDSTGRFTYTATWDVNLIDA